MPNMNIEKFIPNIGFAITLLVIAQSASGFQRTASYCGVVIITASAIVLLLENKTSKHWWKKIVQQAEGLNINYVAFGVGLMLVSKEFSNIVWVSLLLLVSGVLFASVGISKLIGKGGSELIKSNAIIGIIVGFIILIVGIINCILTWDSIVEKWLTNASYPILIIGTGIIFIYFGFRKWREKPSGTSKN